MEPVQSRKPLDGQAELTFETAAEHATDARADRRHHSSGSARSENFWSDIDTKARAISSSVSGDKFLGIMTMEDLLCAPADATVESLMDREAAHCLARCRSRGCRLARGSPRGICARCR